MATSGASTTGGASDADRAGATPAQRRLLAEAKAYTRVASDANGKPRRKHVVPASVSAALVEGVKTFGANFLLAYNVRAGIALLLHAVKLARSE